LVGAVTLPGCESAAPATPFVAARRLLQQRIAPARASWMDPAAKSIKRLLYVADIVTNDVFVYNYDTGGMVGQLTGFAAPGGLCVDATGDVWITNYTALTIDEYAHGGTQQIGRVHTAKMTTGCAVDPTTGDLAATWAGPGAVLRWKNARGRVDGYYNTGCVYLWPPGYDDQGNLYVEGESTTGIFNICELPHGSKTLRTVSSNVPIDYPAGVTWDGKYLVLADQTYQDSKYSGLYRATEDASGNLTEVSGTELVTGDCDADDVIVPFIVGKKNTPLNREQGTVVLGPSVACRDQFYYWAYPAGGDPTKTLAYPALADGEAVSIATGKP
jgi:hypothetical protein